MNDQLRNEIVVLHHGGASIRRIARMLHVSRSRVTRVLEEHELARRGLSDPDGLPRPSKSRPSMLDGYDEKLRDLVQRFPNITAIRALEELQGEGFVGHYTIVKERLRHLRPKPTVEAVVRMDTAPGQQAQMDYSPYKIPFTVEGLREVHAFSYLLSYSRRQYLRFVDTQDFDTTVREHVKAFEYLDGVAATCLYDSFKVVVSHWDGEEPIYNTRFLAFATHYGFRPWACKRRRPQTKGRVERRFDFVEKNLLNGRSFHSLAHLNEVAQWWLNNVADARPHRETHEPPIDRYRKEQPYLLRLPDHRWEVATVVYRVVSTEGTVSHLQNAYSVSPHLIGQLLPVRITESELIVYGKDIKECARHPLYPRSTIGERHILDEHRPKHRGDPLSVLRERFADFGIHGSMFLDGLLKGRRYGRKEAARVLELLNTYTLADVISAIDRAVRYHAFSSPAVERILAAHATPRTAAELLQDQCRFAIAPGLSADTVTPRDTAEYQSLLGQEDPITGADQHGQQEESQQS
jgi:transposase